MRDVRVMVAAAMIGVLAAIGASGAEPATSVLASEEEPFVFDDVRAVDSTGRYVVVHRRG